MQAKVYVQVIDIHKKLARRFRYALWYEWVDLWLELFSRKKGNRALRKGEFWALKKINFEIINNESLGILAPNGCGKTTLIKLLAGLIKPDRGLVKIKGRVLFSSALGAGFAGTLNGLDNIFINATLLGLSREQIKNSLDSIIEFSGLGDLINTPLENYSQGMKFRLAVSIGIHKKPDILVFDELHITGDQEFKNKCFKWIEEHKQNMAMIVISHDMKLIKKLCNNIMVMKDGAVVHLGDDLDKGARYFEKVLESET